MAQPALETLGAHLRDTRLLGSIHSTLYWDQNTLMPPAGASWRGEQLALLARQLHQRQSSDAYAELLAAAEASEPASEGWRRNLSLLRQDLERQRRLDPSLVAELALAQADGYSLWQQARARADFSSFAPALRRLIALRQEQARQLAPVEKTADGQPRSCWEILAQPFEPGISKRRLNNLFAPLRQRLPELIAHYAGPGSRPLPQPCDLADAAQQSLCLELLQAWGFDAEKAVLARSPHPFSTTLGPRDFRITSRVVPGQPFSAFLATAHEWGHSLYEQGLPRQDNQWFSWPLGDATSMGVHESQSLFWECRVARSEAFARRWQPRFAQALAGSGSLFQALNPRRPGLNRVEADELSYCLHIVFRYDLELALLEGDLPVEELPAAWNLQMKELLGLEPADAAQGCLQDVHWSEGLFGYFPSYALGHLISAQLAETMERETGPIEALVAAGDEESLRQWLRQHVHPLGRSVTSEELVTGVCGKPLGPEAFLSYLETKLERLAAGDS
ncbi:MAG: carboxypeptidase M32 [Cyanobacteria bacterium]|nr:carboxypeptidase M32 [Cyanobacteria bacterium bin.51]